ncbi:sugar kinase [Psychroflexus sp. MES1-P1E]|nr:sugar kinase [Psychroflexus sp. MES1-P1E]
MELVGVDIGGSNLKAGKIVNGKIEKKSMKSVSKNATYNQVLNDLFACIDEVITPNTKRIGIGVPSIVDISKGIAYDVQNIPAWKLVPLKELIEERYGILVYLNNDANCFALGEKIYGKGLPYKNFVGLSLGTGIGMGIIINDSLYSGVLCGAGEIGMVSYKESIIENYASSFFFIRKYGLHPIEVFERAEKGEAKSIIAFQDFGFHLAEAIKTILYLYAPEAILIGGSISKAYKYFQESLQTNLKSFPYKKQIENLKIEVSTNQGSPILGAAALCLQEKN